MIGPEGPTLELSATRSAAPANDQELQDFIAPYTPPAARRMPFLPPDVTPREAPTSSGWYLLRIDRAGPRWMAWPQPDRGGKRGVYRFSSEEGARTLAVVARRAQQQHRHQSAGQLQCALEHPKTRPPPPSSMRAVPVVTEDSDPATRATRACLPACPMRGLSQLPRHLEVPGTYYIPKIAIIDIGFDLDPVTGIPVDGNLDYGTLGAPMQWDVADQTQGRRPRRRAPAWTRPGVFRDRRRPSQERFGSAGVGGHSSARS